MFNISKNLGLLALVCSLAGLVGCGGSSGTDKKAPPVTANLCGSSEIRLADGSCGAPPELPDCPIGQIRVNGGACFTPDKPAPVYTPKDDEVVIYFNSADKDFAGYTAHLWQTCGNGWQPTQNTDGTVRPIDVWENGIPLSSSEDGPIKNDPIYGAYFILKTSATGACGNFIIHGNGNQTNDLKVNITRTGGMYDRMYFVIRNLSDMRNSRDSASPICINDVCKKYEAPALAISDVTAHWVDKSTLLLNGSFTNVKLYKAAAGKTIAANAAITPYDSAKPGTTVTTDQLLTNAEFVTDLTEKTNTTTVPHLTGYKAYDLDLSVEDVKALQKGELVVVWKSNDETAVNVKDSDGKDVLDGNGEPTTADLKLFNGTHIQNSYLLDDLYTSGTDDADEKTLGVNYDGSTPTISVWAPTATKVELRVYNNNLKYEGSRSMTENSATGIWSLDSDPLAPSLDLKFYRFYVIGYNSVTNKVEQFETTDPHSVSLSTNGLYSQFVNLDSDDLKPKGWPGRVLPPVSPEAMSIYEMHVRDFSINDKATTAAYRGKYLAFTEANTPPVNHLKALAEKGLTHVHLLPVFDGASIEEDANKQVNLDSYVFDLCLKKGNTTSGICAFNDQSNRKKTIRSVLEGYDSTTDDALTVVNLMKDLDGFNWNYDPEHYNAPEGSYATNPHGVTRIKEMRAMNMALHEMGLRVVYDVVFPHMNAAVLTTSKSTFEKIVPGYYFRNNVATGVPIDEAGPQTATEHPMFAKFISDSLVQWAKQYKVDGFRFDQSGRLPKSVVTNALAKVQEVDANTYFYGEAWNDSELARARVGGAANLATQASLVDTGIGSFNDKLRDPLRNFAIVNGGSLDPVRAGLAGNLTTFRLKAKSGSMIDASSAGAYGHDPKENIAYADVHDNETLWDWMQKADVLPADTTLANRVRIQNLTLSIPALSQGIPVFQMGSEMLRSKSMDDNSYNSGDWFNAVDFTMASNNWNIGLPVTEIDSSKAVADYSDSEKSLQKKIDAIIAAVTDAATKPAKANIEQASAVFNEFLEIRNSSPLFSLGDAASVKARVGFHDGGITQEDNVIVMSIDDGAAAGTDLDPDLDAIVVIFNGTNAAITKKIFTADGFELHEVQQNSVDSVVKTATFTTGAGGDAGRGIFTVPAYTTAVFVKPQSVARTGLSATATTDHVWTTPYGATQIYLPGAFTTPNWSVFDATNELVYKSEGVYSVVIPITASSTPYAFKIASSDWSTVDKGAPAASPKISLGVAKVFGTGSDYGNASIKISETAKYRFTLDASNSVNPILTVSKLDLDIYNGTTLYVRGTVSATGWGADASNTIPYDTNGLYTKTLNLAAGSYQFKIADNDWTAATTFGAGNTTLGSGLGGTDNITITVTDPGDYVFTLDAKTDPHTITVEKAD